MAKGRTEFVCQQCGAKTVSWLGRCPECGAWNSLMETIIAEERPGGGDRLLGQAKPLLLSDIKNISYDRLVTSINEFDRVLGGGIVPGSVVLMAGEPGIGKSTLLLQVAVSLANSKLLIGKNKRKSKNHKAQSASHQPSANTVLYISGEESPEQIKMRADRVVTKINNLLVLSHTDTDLIVEQIYQLKPKLVVIDSIQTMQTQDLNQGAGSIGQVRESAARFVRVAKEEAIPVFLIGHITKEGAIAGPKVLEHMVDAVLYFEGDQNHTYRILRSIKNRYGSTSEVGVFQMSEKGLGEVKNPSDVFLGKRVDKQGSIAFAALAGERPILSEIQALTTPSNFANPRRVVSGIDYNRLQLIGAVLSKVLKMPLLNFDVYVSTGGGLDLAEPASDLAVALAIISSLKDKPIVKDACAFGEIGLLGELRRVRGEEMRSKEAKRLGFKKFVTPSHFGNIFEAQKFLFG